MAMLGKRRPSRPTSGHSGLARTRERQSFAQGDTSTPLVIERLAHDGRGVSHDATGKTVFVDQALPGEEVEVGVHLTRKRFDEAHVKRRLSSSLDRVAAPCIHFSQCGGCDLQHIEINAQRAHKREVVKELMARQGIKLEGISALNGHQEHYRRRARLGVKVDSQGKVMFGFRAPHTHRLVDITQCPVLVPELQALITPLRTLLATLEAPRLVGHIELLATAEVTVVLVRQLKEHTQDRVRWQIFAEEQKIALGAWLGRDTPTLHWLSAAPLLYERLELSALGVDRRHSESKKASSTGSHTETALIFHVSPGDFVQVNAEVNHKMVAQVIAWLTPASDQQLLDLFAGIGNFSLPLAAAGFSVHAVEGSPTMVERITANARLNHLDVSAQQADLSDTETVHALLREHCQTNALILDPPRSGAEAICRALGRYQIPKVVYISCDPATLARDTAHLMHAGYRVVHVAVADMFLHTAHMETLILFEYEG